MQKLSKDDIDAIVSALLDSAEERDSNKICKDCRFLSINPEELQESIQFYKNFNAVFGKTGNIIWTTLLVAGIGTVIGLIALGFIAKIKQYIL